MPSVSPKRSEPPLVLAIDVGTTSVRAMLFDRKARDIRGTAASAETPLAVTPDGGATIDAEKLLDVTLGVIDRAFDAANEIGDLTYAVFTRSILITNMLAAGDPLDEVLHEAEHGFAFVQMARALLREPDLVQHLQRDTNYEALCIHCNKCMPTIYRGTRCVLVPES